MKIKTKEEQQKLEKLRKETEMNGKKEKRETDR